MRVTSSGIERAKDKPGRVRLVGEVEYDGGGSDRYWFEVADRHADELSTTGNTWLAGLLPLAVCNREPLRIDLPVDRLLYENIRELMYVWQSWYPRLPVIEIEAEVSDDAAGPERPRVGSFFTGGVDSIFTLLQHVRSFTPDAPFEIDDLITICGYDIPLRNAENFARRYARQQKAAAIVGKELLDVFTNTRETVVARIDEKQIECSSMWGRICHACGLASIAYALEKRFRKVVISSTYSYAELVRIPCGTHPLIDHLLSTRRTNVFHYGAGFDRAEKVMYIADSEVVKQSLQVCWILLTEENCCRCLKCYQTMIPLEIAGVLKDCTTFKRKSLDLKRLEKLFIEHDHQAPFYRELQQLARKHDRPDIAAALDKAFERSELIHRKRRLGDYLSRKPLLWRLTPRLRKSIRKMEADSIR